MIDKSIDEDLTLEIPADDAVTKPVEIAIEGDKAEVVETKPAEADRPEPVVEDEGVKTLRQQLQTERQRANEAAADRDRIAKQAQVEVTDANYQVVLGAIDRATKDGETAEAAYAKAAEAGDYVAAAKAQRLMAKVELALSQLDGVKAQIEANAKRPATEGRVERPRDENADPVESFASSLTPASATWVRQHPEYVRDASLNKKMLGAHHMALGDGLQPDTPDYFAHVEKTLGIGHNDDGAKPTAPPDRPSPSFAAPVSRDTPSLASGKPQRQTVTLTPEERAMARDLDMSEKDYAIQKLAIENDKRSGKMN